MTSAEVVAAFFCLLERERAEGRDIPQFSDVDLHLGLCAVDADIRGLKRKVDSIARQSQVAPTEILAETLIRFFQGFCVLRPAAAVGLSSEQIGARIRDAVSRDPGAPEDEFVMLWREWRRLITTPVPSEVH